MCNYMEERTFSKKVVSPWDKDHYCFKASNNCEGFTFHTLRTGGNVYMKVTLAAENASKVEIMTQDGKSYVKCGYPGCSSFWFEARRVSVYEGGMTITFCMSFYSQYNCRMIAHTFIRLFPNIMRPLNIAAY